MWWKKSQVRISLNIAKMFKVANYKLLLFYVYTVTFENNTWPYDWNRVMYKWVISFRCLKPFCNRIVWRTIVDGIQTIICYRLDKYKPIHKAAVLSNVVSFVHFVETFFNCEITLHFPHLNMLKPNIVCFVIHTHVDNDVTFWNINDF